MKSVLASIVMPSDHEMLFKEWWLKLDASAMVMVHYPHGHHGNACQTLRYQYLKLCFLLVTLTASRMKEIPTQVVQSSISSVSTVPNPKDGCPNYD